ncbi:MAG TPA: hypothetical protein VKY27_04030 [Bacteriovoracaceae bacterium]|nr:hypothetical protein [Bacteriovoracaceae bacterium]
MMNSFKDILETYFTVLVHPFKVHGQFRFQMPSTSEFSLKPLTLAEAIGVSWVFSILRGFLKILILNFFIIGVGSSFSGVELGGLFSRSMSSGYAFFVLSTALDILFFPIAALIINSYWAWVIRLFIRWLNPKLDREKIADEITTHALSSHVLGIIPFIGEFFQFLYYYFLLYAGLRGNLGASRSFSLVVLVSPLLVIFMILTLLTLPFFI